MSPNACIATMWVATSVGLVAAFALVLSAEARKGCHDQTIQITTWTPTLHTCAHADHRLVRGDGFVTCLCPRDAGAP